MAHHTGRISAHTAFALKASAGAVRWQTSHPGGYHVEYGFSCVGYEIAGGPGVKLAQPEREVFVMVGDGSYLMLNSELATAVMLGQKLTVVVLDNRGYGCINRL
jgi:3D-(3,5/4)-trihydroxycyclohexane-1,2-dione acylhydrolase (decyclizing)